MSAGAELEKPAVFMITGAGNLRIRGSLSPMSFVYHELRRATASCEYLIPEHLGVGTLDFSYNALKGVIDKKVAKYPESQNKILVGHSLGGAIAARYMAENPDSIDRVVAVAGVFGPVLLGIGSKMVRKYTRETEEMLEDVGEERLYCLGSVHDELVPVDSALPEMAGDNRTVIDSRVKGSMNRWSRSFVPFFVKQHALLVSHPEVLEEVSTLTETS